MKKSLMNKTALVALAAVLTIAAYLVFRLLLSGEAPDYATEIAAAVFGGLLTAGVTMILLNEQTQVEMRKDRNTVMLQEKMNLYKELNKELKAILKADDLTGHVVEVQLLCQSLAVVAREEVVAAFNDFVVLFAEAARSKKLSAEARDEMLEALVAVSVQMRKDVMSPEEEADFTLAGREEKFTGIFDTTIRTLKTGKLTWDEFIQTCSPKERDYFSALSTFAAGHGMKLEMGTVGFSVRSSTGTSLLWGFPSKSGKGLEVQFTRSKISPEAVSDAKTWLRQRGIPDDKLTRKIVSVTIDELDLDGIQELLTRMEKALSQQAA